MKPDLLRKGFWLGLVLTVAALLVVVLIEGYEALGHAPRLEQSRAQVVHTFEVITAAEALDHAVQDAERGQRGYLLTGSSAYLESYRAGSRDAPILLAKLRELTADNPDQQRRWSELELALNARLADMQRTLAVAERAGPDIAPRLAQSGNGLEATRAIGALIAGAIAAERSVLGERLEGLAAEEHRVAEVALLSGAIAFAAVLIGLALATLALRSIMREQEERGLSDQRFRLLVDGVPDYAIYTLDPEGNVTTWNRGAERLKGYSAEEALGSNFSRFWTPEARDEGAPARALEVALSSGRFEAEGVRVRKDGSRFWASVNITPLRDSSGRHIGFAKITRNVTERREQRQALEQTREALAQAQKMDALGQLSGGIAHDFNNLLHVILNCVEILERRLHGIGADTREYLEMVKRNASRAAGLTQRMLAFARRQPLEPRPISPNQLITGMADLLQRALGESVVLETRFGSRGWQVSVDANQLEATILNLAINARDAMAGGGSLVIETENVFLDEAYNKVHSDVSIGQYVAILVSDSGCGMTPEILAKAFEPFFTTKEPGKGTGLGLSQVYGFIKQSGGHIRMTSEPGRGTTVRMYLPRLLAASADIAWADHRSAPVSRAAEAILVVEDDVDVRVFTAEVLKELGYRVIAVPDARSALQTLEERPDINLLFTDVGLPDGINGRQLADQARQRWPEIKVLFTTGYDGTGFVPDGRLEAAPYLIPKPFTRSGLAQKVKEVLELQA